MRASIVHYHSEHNNTRLYFTVSRKPIPLVFSEYDSTIKDSNSNPMNQERSESDQGLSNQTIA